MVTRKPVPAPTLNTTSASSSNAPPYPTTPQAELAKTTATDSSVYSPNLHTSPAFDLIDMREAQQRARRDSDISSHGTWDSDDTDPEPEEEGGELVEIPQPLNIKPSRPDLVVTEQQQWREEQEKEHALDAVQHNQTGSSLVLPNVLVPGRVSAGSQSAQSLANGHQYTDESQTNPWKLDSNNPYLKHNGLVDNSQSSWKDQISMPTISVPAARHPPPPAQAPPQPPISPAAPPLHVSTQTPVELPASDPLADGLSDMSLYTTTPRVAHRPIDIPSAPVPIPSQDLSSSYEELSHTGEPAFPSTNPWGSRSASQSREHDRPASQPPTIPSAPSTDHHYPPPPGPPPGYAARRLIDHEEPPNARQDPSPPYTPVLTSHHDGSSASRHHDASPPYSSAPVQASNTSTSQGQLPQSNTTYQIKHINWHDASYAGDPRMRSETRTSPILMQNANGPCPLLALVNALVLSMPSNQDTPLVRTLRTREDISLELLLTAVFDELTSGRRSSTTDSLPDISELYAFLLALHTGMNVNPQFVTPAVTPRGSLDGYPPELGGMHPTHRSQSKAGAFQETKEMRLYSTFGIPLIHGWTAPGDSPAYQAFARSAHTFEDAQNIQFSEAELEDKMRSAGLTGQEQQTLQDIQTIKAFLNTWPTQLTEHGLESISKSLASGDIAILFRNDHFTTLHKEPRHGALMTLVTDAGYRSHAEIVWESLVDVNGAASELFSGDFRSVSHGVDAVGGSTTDQDGWQQVQSRNQAIRNAQVPLRITNSSPEVAPPLPGPRPHERNASSSHLDIPPTDHQRSASEQEDHDMALAMQLQMEEEDNEREAEARRQRERQLTEEFLSNEDRPAVPPRRSPNARASTVNPIPPPRPGTARFTSNRAQPVSRPVDDADPDAPPTYEQAASDRPYRPAGSTAAPLQGNPLGAYDALRSEHRSSTSVNSIDAATGRRRSDINRIRRRSSQMGTIAPRTGFDGSNSPTGGPGRAPAYPGRVGGQDDERCVMM